MKRTFVRFSQLTALVVPLGLIGLTGCDKNGQAGVLQRPAKNKDLKEQITPDRACDKMFDTSLSKLGDSTYLIITKAERGSVFTLHTGPRPAADHAVCFASINNPGFRECVEDYYHAAGAVAIQNNEAGWWATPL
ncbi:hypothetical protein [Hymenobacter terrenus]|uniref:hypothetical protein n=1 Tax=Hymenobacter terrenus TaxID=1629124 RepID=UPI0012E0A002|nr:hypothetical protein [Hymenobacter terrenus]